jgi:hypothetical protein
MANSPFDANPAFTKLGDDTRKAVIQAFDAMSNWRSELAEIGEKNSNAVFDKMAEAAKSLGWPTDFVELSRKQMQNASKLQLQAVDQVMDVWEKQVKSLGSASQVPNFPAGFGGAPGLGGAGLFPGMPDFSGGAGNPLQFWMQAAEMWQKGWQQAMASWIEAQQSAMGKGGSSGRPNSR